MMTREAITRIANTTVDALPTITWANRRNGSGHFIASDDMSTRLRIAASAAKAMPNAARIRPNCR